MGKTCPNENPCSVPAAPEKLKHKKNWLPYFVYGLLSLAILGPLLARGYVLTLDMLFAPHASFTGNAYGLNEWFSTSSANSTASTPLFMVVQGISRIIPEWLVEKLILFLILFLAGLGAHRLFGSKGPGAYFAGILYMVNPFTYVRFLAGQWGVLWAYALTPWAIKAFIELLEQPNLKKAIKVAALSTLVGLVHMQEFFLLLLAFIVIFIVHLIRERKDSAKLLRDGKFAGIGAGLFCALNIYWLVPLLTSKSTIASQLSRADLLAFAPRPSSSFGVAFDTASMHGFWRGGYTYVQDILSFWWVLFIFILFLAIYGFVSRLRDTRQGWLVLSFGAIGVVSFLLALGAASELTRPVFDWLWDHFSFFRGFRDSQKFVALLCLAYAYLGGLGVNEFANVLKQQRERLQKIGMMAVIAVAMVTPLVYSFTMFGFHGQLGTTDYPREWYQVNDYLNEDKGDFNVLFLPWHLYMDYSWLPNKDKRLANPAQQFFDKPVIAGDNMEYGGIYSQSTNPISKYVEFLLQNKAQMDNLGELLAPLNVKYVILVHEVDYRSYDFLYQQTDLSVELEKPGITLLKNEHPTARVYAVDSVVHIDSLEQYLELSKTQDVTEHLYVLGNGPTDGINSPSSLDQLAMGSNLDVQEGGFEGLESTEKSPVRFKVGATERKYTVFTVPQDVTTKHWEYNGKNPELANLGFMPAFQSSDSGGDVVYTRFYRVYLPSYVVSAIALALMLWLYFRRSKHTFVDTTLRS